MLGNYFYHEIIRKIVTAFGSLFNEIEIRHKNSDGDYISQIRVPIAYGPTQKFLARIEQQPELNKPIAITLPRMSFEMTSLQYDPSRKTTLTQTFKALEGNNLKKVFMPVPYNIGFELNVMTKLQDDALQVVEQIIPFFQPSYNISIKLIDSLNEYRDIPVILDSISFQDDYEGDFSTRRTLIYTFQFTVKAYFFNDVSQANDGLIRKVQVDSYTGIDPLSANREERYTVRVDPYDANPTDAYGFVEERFFFDDSRNYSPTQQLDV